MISFPHAKINLGLQVVEKRHDGFHNIISCFYPIGWCDVLEVIPASRFSFESSGLVIPGDPRQNLCLQAYEILKNDYFLPNVRIHLHKVIPIGSGLGGGSSDAAHMLKMLVALFELKVAPAALKAYAASLGSDCPFFLDTKPQMVTGRGDLLSPLELTLPDAFLLVVCPDIQVNTAQAYARLQPQKAQYDLQLLLQKTPLERWQGPLKNDFEKTVFAQYPKIKDLKELLYQMGADYVCMSGSGSSVFGFFKLRPDLKDIPSLYKSWLQQV